MAITYDQTFESNNTGITLGTGATRSTELPFQGSYGIKITLPSSQNAYNQASRNIATTNKYFGFSFRTTNVSKGSRILSMGYWDGKGEIITDTISYNTSGVLYRNATSLSYTLSANTWYHFKFNLSWSSSPNTFTIKVNNTLVLDSTYGSPGGSDYDLYLVAFRPVGTDQGDIIHYFDNYWEATTDPGTVDITNDPLTFSYQSGNPVSYQITTNMDALATRKYICTGLPDGLSIDESTGLISGTPT